MPSGPPAVTVVGSDWGLALALQEPLHACSRDAKLAPGEVYRAQLCGVSVDPALVGSQELGGLFGGEHVGGCRGTIRELGDDALREPFGQRVQKSVERMGFHTIDVPSDHLNEFDVGLYKIF